jgi:hypothetical protein
VTLRGVAVMRSGFVITGLVVHCRLAMVLRVRDVPLPFGDALLLAWT